MVVSVARRVFFVGDSFVAGVGDPDCLGWVGRLAVRAHRDGAPITAYNLGVRRNTSEDVRRRWSGEVAARRAADCEERLVVSFGVNDTTVAAGQPRGKPARSVTNLRAVAAGATAVGLEVLVVGPPPVANPGQIERIAALDERFSAVCAATAVMYVSVFGALVDDPAWRDEVRSGDGAHPSAAGYTLLAGLVLPRWCDWRGWQDSAP